MFVELADKIFSQTATQAIQKQQQETKMRRGLTANAISLTRRLSKQLTDKEAEKKMR